MSSDSIFELLVWQTVQVTLVAVAALAITKCFAKNRPHFAHAMWALVLLKCLTPPLIPSPTSPFSWMLAKRESSVVRELESLNVPFEVAMQDITPPPRPPGYLPPELTIPGESQLAAELQSESKITSNPNEALRRKSTQPTTSHNWTAFFLSVWAVGSATVFAAFLFRFVRFVHSIRRATVATPAGLAAQVHELCGRLKIRQVRVQVVDQPTGPAILGLLRPTIVLPKVVVNSSNESNLEPLLAHELMHFRRGDLWWSAVQVASLCLWWCHPLIWIAGRLMSREAERSCDEETIASLGCSPARYARSLLNVLEQKQQLRAAPLLPGIRPVDLTAKRMERIMRLGQGCHRRCPAWVWATFFIGAITLLPGAALVIGQEDRTKPTPRVVRKLQDTAPLLPAAPYRPNHRRATDGLPILESYPVGDLLQRAQQELGIDREAAEGIFIDRLGLAVVDDDNTKRIEFSLFEDEVEEKQVTLGGEESSAKIVKEVLYVFESKRLQDRVESTVERLRKSGFIQFCVEVEIFELPVDFLWDWEGGPNEVVHASHKPAAKSQLNVLSLEKEEALLEVLRTDGSRVTRSGGPRLFLDNGSTGLMQSGQRFEVEIPEDGDAKRLEVQIGFRLEVSISASSPVHDGRSFEAAGTEGALVTLKFRQGWLEPPQAEKLRVDGVAIPMSRFRSFECGGTMATGAGTPAGYVLLPPDEGKSETKRTLVLIRCRQLPTAAPAIPMLGDIPVIGRLFSGPDPISEEQLRKAWVTVSGKLTEAAYATLIDEYARAGIEKHRRTNNSVQVIALQGGDTVQKPTWKRALEIQQRVSAALKAEGKETKDSDIINTDKVDSATEAVRPKSKQTKKTEVTIDNDGQADLPKEPTGFDDLSLEDCISMALTNAKFLRVVGGNSNAASGVKVRSDLGVEGALIVDPKASEEEGVEESLREFDAQHSAAFGYEVRSKEVRGKDEPASSEHRATPAGEAANGQPILIHGRGTLKRKIPIRIAPNDDDMSLLQFEAKVRNLVKSVEDAYWDLYAGYRSFEAAKEAQASALNLWRVAQARTALGDTPPEAEAQARALYYQFTAQLHSSLYGSRVPGNYPLGLYGRERVLREKLGWGPTDGKLIRTTTDPSVAQALFDWNETIAEAIERNCELRQHKFVIDQRKSETQQARQQFPSDLDDVELFDRPLVFRKARRKFHVSQIQLKKCQIELEEQEISLVHELADVYAQLANGYQQMKDYLDQWLANEDEVRIYNERIKDNSGELGMLLDNLLRAEERRSRAEQLYYQAVCEYNKTLVNVHYLKGSLLDYNNISLVEGSEGKSSQ